MGVLMGNVVNRSKRRTHAGWRWLLVCVVYMLAGAVPLAVGVLRPGITGYHRCLLEDMVSGQAYQPFVKRQLVPLIVRAGMAVTPESIDGVVQKAFIGSSLVQYLRWPPVYASEFLLTLIVMYAGMIGFMVFLRRFLSSCLEIPLGIARAVSLSVAVGLPVCYAGQVYIYDYTQLLLFTGGLLYMMKGRWPVYYPIFALACLNKETSILLPIVFACWKGRKLLRWMNLKHFMAQVVIAMLILVALAVVYRHNPGSNTEWHLERNLAMQFSVLAWVRLAVLALCGIFALWGMRTAPSFLNRGFLATLSVLLPATFLFGYIDELRDYYEALPFAVVLITAAILDIVMRYKGTYKKRD